MSLLANFSMLSGSSDVQQEISLTGLTALRAYGDSLTFGTAASTSTERYINQFVSGKGLSLSNQGVSGYAARNVTTLISQHTTNTNTILNTLMVGLNTLSSISTTPTQFGASAFTEQETCYRHVFHRGIMSGAGDAGGSAAVTRSGTINGYAANSNGGTYPTGTFPGNFASISSGAASWTWTTTSGNFIISFVARATHGTGTITVNGVTVHNLDLKQYYTGTSVSAMSLSFWGYPAGATVVVNASGDAPIAVDYFAEIKTPANSASFLFAETTYCTEAGYASLGSGLANRTKTDQWNSMLRTIVNEFRARGYNIARVRPNLYFDPNNTSDGVHPNDAGMDQITTAFNAAV